MTNNDDALPEAPSPAERAAQRRADLEAIVFPCIERAFAADASLRSAMFVVAQYWNDNATDEVHGEIVFSPAGTPRWPHRCRGFAAGRSPERDTCTRCRPGEPFEMPYTDASMRAWEPYCDELASQEMSVGEAYLPYLVVRRDRPPELVGRPVRSWLEMEGPAAPCSTVDRALASVYADPDSDAARHVAADALLERDDPRGEYLALALAGDPAVRARGAAILARHERAWLGPLAAVVPPAMARFDRGFLDDVDVYFHEDQDLGVLTADEWATVRRIRFLPMSARHLSPAMRSLRDVGPLPEHLVGDLADAAEPCRIERLHIELTMNSVDFLALALDGGKLPALRELIVPGSPELPVVLASLLPRHSLTVDVGNSTRRPTAPFDPDLVASLLTARLPAPLAFGAFGASGSPAGAWAYLRLDDRDRVVGHVTFVGIDGRFDTEDMVRALAALRDRLAMPVTVTAEPSPWFDPTARDREMLAALVVEDED